MNFTTQKSGIGMLFGAVLLVSPFIAPVSADTVQRRAAKAIASALEQPPGPADNGAEHFRTAVTLIDKAQDVKELERHPQLMAAIATSVLSNLDSVKLDQAVIDGVHVGIREGPTDRPVNGWGTLSQRSHVSIVLWKRGRSLTADGDSRTGTLYCRAALRLICSDSMGTCTTAWAFLWEAS